MKSKMYEYIFDNKSFPYDTSFYKFLIIDSKNLDTLNIIKLSELFSDLFVKIDIFDYKNKMIVCYFCDLEYNVKNIIETVYIDFGIEFKVFESGRINIKNPDAFLILFDVYNNYSSVNSRLYTSNASLILDTAKIDYNKLKVLRPIILNKINEDDQLANLITGMFNNNLNVTKTASEVYMHRNTINNKLNIIKAETSLDIQTFTDAVSLYLLMKAK